MTDRRTSVVLRATLGLSKANIVGTAEAEEKENEERKKIADELEERKLKEQKELEHKQERDRKAKIKEQIELEKLEEKQIRERYAKMTPEEKNAADNEEIIGRGF